MNNKQLALILICSLTLLLQACGSDGSEKSETPPPAAAFQPGTYPRFDPVVGDVPFNTDLIFANAAKSDGTADVGAASDPVRRALNQLDGFSNSAYFDILISGPVDPASVTTSSVFLLELNTGTKDALDPANITGIVGPATYSVGVASLDGVNNNAIRITPLVPLKAKAKYLVFITDDVKDTSAKPLTPSWTYNALRDANYAASGLGSLTAVRTAISGWETLASGFLSAVSNGALTPAAAKQKIVLSYTFTTTDPQTPLVAMASPVAAIATAQIAAGATPAEAVGQGLLLDQNNLLPSPKARNLGISEATGVDIGLLSGNALASDISTLYTGYIQLPYYQTAPEGMSFDFLQTNWQPDLTLAAAMGVSLPTDIDQTSYNMTYRFPFARASVIESVPLQVTMPQDNLVPGYAGLANCGQIYATTGYPVVIYVHGITSDRASVISLAHTLAGRCVATVSIDLVMHGIAANSAFVNALNVEHSGVSALYGDHAPRERHFNVAGAGGSPAPMNFTNPTAADGSGAQFINLAYLANTRDNLRQSVVDLLNLNASLGNLNAALSDFLDVGIDTNRVYVVGMSLGGIIGTNFIAANQLALAGEAQLSLASQVAIPSTLNPVRGVVLSAAGTQVSQIIVNSPTYGPTINAGLAAAGVNQGSSNYERFVYAIQSIVESGDPVSFSQILGNLPGPFQVSVLLQQVKDDQVVLNSIAKAPLAGTEAMADLMGLNQLGLGATALGLGHVKMNAGVHSSLLRPDENAPQITAEFQAQVATFVLGDGEVAIGSQAPANVELPE